MLQQVTIAHAQPNYKNLQHIEGVWDNKEKERRRTISPIVHLACRNINCTKLKFGLKNVLMVLTCRVGKSRHVTVIASQTLLALSFSDQTCTVVEGPWWARLRVLCL
jgi:hypothetical protein